MSLSLDGRRARVDGEHTRAQILTFLTAYHEAHHRAPTYAEIAEAVGVVRGNVHHHIQTLRDAGLVRVKPGPRGVTPVGGTS